MCKIQQNQNKDYGASFTEEKFAFQEEEKIVGISMPQKSGVKPKMTIRTRNKLKKGTEMLI